MAEEFTIDELKAMAGPPSADSYSIEELKAIAGAPSSGETPSFWSMDYGGESPTFGGMVMSGSQGALKGALKTITLPADIASFAVNKASQGLGFQEPLGYMSNLIDEATTAVAGGYDPHTAQNSPERTAETVGEFTASAPVFYKAGAKLAAQQAFPRLAKFGNMLASNPGSQIRTAAAAGLGSAAAQEAFPDSLLANILLPLAGGASYAGLEAGGSGLVKALRTRLSPGIASEAARTEAKQVIEQFADPAKIVKALEQSDLEKAALPWIEKQGEKFLPQYRRTAEITQDPGVSLLEQTLRRTSPELERQVAQQDAAREGARQAIYGALAKNPMTDEAIGQSLRTGLAANLKESEESIAKLAAKAFKGGEEVPTYPSKIAVSNALQTFTKDGSKQISPQFQELIDNFRSLPPKVDLQTMQNYRSAFGEWGSVGANATPVERATAKIATTLRLNIDSTVEKLAGQGRVPKAQYNAWRKLIDTRAEQGAKFQSGPVGDVLSKTFGRYDVPGSEVASKAIGTVEDARQVMSALTRQAPSREALRTSVIQTIYEKSVDPVSKTFNTRQFVKQLQKMGEVNAEVLTAPQRNALSLIEKDLVSQGSVQALAFKASKNQSITSQAQSAIELLQKSISAETPGMLDRIHPALGSIWKFVNNVARNPEGKRQLLNAELAKFVTDPQYAAALLRQPNAANLEAVLPKFYASMIANVENTTRSVRDIEKQAFAQGVM